MCACVKVPPVAWWEKKTEKGGEDIGKRKDEEKKSGREGRGIRKREKEERGKINALLKGKN